MFNHQAKNTPTLIAAVLAIDLEPIKFSLVSPKGSIGWTRQRADETEKKYRQFLFLIAANRGALIPPTQDIDTFWHAHILDSVKYHDDCQLIFGFYLHHFPYHGVRSEQDAKDLKQAFIVAQKLWFDAFGAPMIDPGDPTPGYAHCGSIGSSWRPRL